MDRTPQLAALAAVIERTSATIELSGIGADELAPWLFTRCMVYVYQFEGGGRNPRDLDLAFADFDALPEDLPGRAKLAATLLTAHLYEAVGGDPGTFARSLALAEIADADPRPLPGWPLTSAVVRAHALVVAGLTGARGFRPRQALAEVERYALIAGEASPHAQMIEMSRLALGFLVAALDNDVLAVDRLVMQTAAFRDRQPPASTTRDRLEVIALAGRIFPAMIRGDHDSVHTIFTAMDFMVDLLPPRDPVRGQVEQLRRASGSFPDDCRAHDEG